VAKLCKKKNIPYYPGCVTPTEIMQAIRLGLHIIKFFPANVYGGLKAMKALSAPFPQIKFIPTGGIDSSNIDEYTSWDKIYAIGGSFFVSDALKKMEEK
jgi:2-dehydro-3-deoxyphosphogluconate aldolase/(4S)-4-hydroxy-2-oxoglutarate aldolase